MLMFRFSLNVELSLLESHSHSCAKQSDEHSEMLVSSVCPVYQVFAIQYRHFCKFFADKMVPRPHVYRKNRNDCKNRKTLIWKNWRKKTIWIWNKFTSIPMVWSHHHLDHQLKSFHPVSSNSPGIWLSWLYQFHCWYMARMNWNCNTDAVDVDHSNNFPLKCAVQRMNRINCKRFWQPNQEKLNARTQLKFPKKKNKIFQFDFVFLILNPKHTSELSGLGWAQRNELFNIVIAVNFYNSSS